MEEFKDFIEGIEDTKHRERFLEVIGWVDTHYPHLKKEMKWNEPCYTDHGTFIISFNIAKQHISFCPENKALKVFEEEIKERGYSYGMMIVKIKWKEEIPYDLIQRMIEFNLEDKKECKSFWRK